VTVPEDTSEPEAEAIVNAAPLPEDLLQPHPRRLPPDTPHYDEILALHAETVRRSGTRYRDPESGLWVMTATHLWQRGYCCYSSCRHCPWVDR
jgi:hypothetical protein